MSWKGERRLGRTLRGEKKENIEYETMLTSLIILT